MRKVNFYYRRYHKIEDTLIGIGGFCDILELMLLLVWHNIPEPIRNILALLMAISIICLAVGIGMKMRMKKRRG